MTATILLVRHAAHAQLGQVLTGRGDDVPLTPAGRAQAKALAERLAAGRLDAVHTSPVRRAQETARAIAGAAGLAETVAPGLDEIDFGAWTGKRYADLSGDPGWQEWNGRRADGRAPGGETMRGVQQRALDHLRAAARESAGAVIAMVSHADVIRAAVAGVLGLPLGRILGFDIDPASVTRIAAGSWGERVMSLNGCAG